MQPTAQPIETLTTLLTWQPGTLGPDERYCCGSGPLDKVKSNKLAAASTQLPLMAAARSLFQGRSGFA